MISPDASPAGAGGSDIAHRLKDDFRQRSLQQVDGYLAKLIYLASCRDYTSGVYRHDGLAFRASEQLAHEVMAASHREVFGEALRLPLAAWVQELKHYLQSTSIPTDCLRIWQEVRPYQVAIPLGMPPLCGDLFLSNLQAALQILQEEMLRPSPGRPGFEERSGQPQPLHAPPLPPR